MNAPSEALKPHIVIIADDEKDIHTVTEVSLRSLSYQALRNQQAIKRITMMKWQPRNMQRMVDSDVEQGDIV